MIAIDKEYYYIDINNIDNFIFNNMNNSRKEEEEEITDGEGKLIQKTKINKTDEEKYINVRYDIIKTMLDVMYNSGIESDEGRIKYLQDVEELSIGTKLVFNTLLENNFIKNKLEQ